MQLTLTQIHRCKTNVFQLFSELLVEKVMYVPQNVFYGMLCSRLKVEENQILALGTISHRVSLGQASDLAQHTLRVVEQNCGPKDLRWRLEPSIRQPSAVLV